MIEGKLAQDRFALAREADADLPPVAFRAVAPDQPALRQAVDQPHRAVMLELQPLGQIAHGRLAGYLAERADAEFEQKVAIKVVHGGTLRRGIRSRFKIERQILAQ